MAKRNSKFVDNGPELMERTIVVKRVAKVVKGGRRFSFNAMVVVGDGKGHVGIGHGKAREVPMAVTKATAAAKKEMFYVPTLGTTIPHPVQGERSAGIVYLAPASAGTGVIAGGSVRAVLECVGISDVLTKSLGSNNAINVVLATIEALKGLKDPREIAHRRGKSVKEIVPWYMYKTMVEQGLVEDEDMKKQIEKEAEEKSETEAKEDKADAKKADAKEEKAEVKEDKTEAEKAKADAKETEAEKKSEAEADATEVDEKAEAEKAESEDKKSEDKKEGDK